MEASPKVLLRKVCGKEAEAPKTAQTPRTEATCKVAVVMMKSGKGKTMAELHSCDCSWLRRVRRHQLSLCQLADASSPLRLRQGDRIATWHDKARTLLGTFSPMVESLLTQPGGTYLRNPTAMRQPQGGCMCLKPTRLR